MRKERITEALGEISPAYIQEAVTYQAEKKRRWPVLAVAACLALVCLGGFLYGHGAGEDLPLEETLPMLEAQFDMGGMGFEAVMLYDIEELPQTNPWTPEADLESLPVYRNLAYTDGAGAPAYFSDREMMDLARDAAEKLGASILSSEYEPLPEGELSYMLTAETDRGTIRVSGNGDISVEFSQPWSLEAAQRLVGYTVDSTWKDYTFAVESILHTERWKAGEELTQAILQYNFARARFALNEEGKAWMASWGDTLQAAEKMGDYQVITLEEARDLLLAGEYITSVPEEYGGVSRETIAREELVYVTGNLQEVFQPYYRFWVELTENPSDRAEGLKTYGAYYVPAVCGIYLADYPLNQ